MLSWQSMISAFGYKTGSQAKVVPCARIATESWSRGSEERQGRTFLEQAARNWSQGLFLLRLVDVPWLARRSFKPMFLAWPRKCRHHALALFFAWPLADPARSSRASRKSATFVWRALLKFEPRPISADTPFACVGDL
ncbi:hypothetical protein BCV70DRAFT_120037 [Testicularia cyperi]|uniref:Uncharacterized protein n=1 Tax=Testicularia cyperi TaxID=1882483 RepID=A0A317XNQ8_9BASI|nr:hypothetical protein BCV70DRAFT_120037 [Testicularia cyperi]